MMMSERGYSSSSTYRYGFNGKENDNDVKGEGNQQDYGMRIYDPRVGRFLSMDVTFGDFPDLTPFQFASNRPIDGVDLDGMEFLKSDEAMVELGIVGYDSKLKKITSTNVFVSADNPNIPNQLSTIIIRDQKQIIDNCNNCIVSPNTMIVGEISQAAANDTKQREISDDIGRLRRYSMTASGQKNFAPTVSGAVKTSSDRAINAMQAEITSLNSSYGVNSQRLGKLGGYVAAINAAAKFLDDLGMSITLNKIKDQTSNAGEVIGIMQKAINNGFDGVRFPEKYFNGSALTDIGRYLLSGQKIYKYKYVDGKEIQDGEDSEMTKFAKQIWDVYQKEQDKARLQKAQTNMQRNTSSKVDKTRNKR